ncbi:MAG: heat-inducible transcription repressor HrcA [Clostridia bacterium]|nr:heat-inducible transcription repressor HrcA [Clostridia bacterium]
MSEFDKQLSERKKQILKAVVEAHIAAGEPVGSKFLVQSNLLSCSSATIRNEMAELEEMGYLEQPHTSAGRVPSELGYRFYVDSLLQHYAMTSKEIDQINSLLKIKMGELDKILEVASKVASNITNYTGIAVKPKQSFVKVLKYELVGIDAHQFAIVMILSTGAIKTKKVKLSLDVDEYSLSRLSSALNTYLTGLCADEITLTSVMQLERTMDDNSLLVNATIKAIYETMNEIDGGELHYSGLNHLLQYPEYSDVNKFGEIINTFEEKDPILNLVAGGGENDINVLIGSENSVNVMKDSAVVFKQIKKDGKTIGAIGVVGPRRMDYARVLATLNELGDNIADLIEDKRLLTENGGDTDAGRS